MKKYSQFGTAKYGNVDLTHFKYNSVVDMSTKDRNSFDVFKAWDNLSKGLNNINKVKIKFIYRRQRKRDGMDKRKRREK